MPVHSPRPCLNGLNAGHCRVKGGDPVACLPGQAVSPFAAAPGGIGFPAAGKKNVFRKKILSLTADAPDLTAGNQQFIDGGSGKKSGSQLTALLKEEIDQIRRLAGTGKAMKTVGNADLHAVGSEKFPGLFRRKIPQGRKEKTSFGPESPGLFCGGKDIGHVASAAAGKRKFAAEAFFFFDDQNFFAPFGSKESRRQTGRAGTGDDKIIFF